MPLVLVLLWLMSSQLAYGQATTQPSAKPNILLIMVDDLRPELGVYGQEHMITPHIDRLANKGTLFKKAYTNFSICGPSRATLLSSLYPSNKRFLEWNCSLDQDVPGVVSLPMHLRNNNYRTISYGKIFNNLDDGKGSWDELWRPVVDSPDMIAWEYLSKEGRKIFEDINQARLKDLRTRTSNHLPLYGPAYESADVPDDAYMDGKVAVKAIEKLQELKLNTAQPFFLAVGFYKPHSPFNAPKKYWDLYDPATLPMPALTQPALNAPDLLKVDRGGVRGYYGIPKKEPIPDSLARAIRHGYFACVSYIDTQVGKILNALEYYGLDKNTIVIFIGDQGHQLGDHGLWDKNQCYQTSSQVPLIVKLPQQEKPMVLSQLVENVDLYPTICDLVGLRRPFHLQGKSFAKLFSKPELAGKEAVYYRSSPNGETILTANYAYTAYYDPKKRLVAQVLFDLQKDPYENNNVANQPTYAAIQAELKTKLEQHLLNREQIKL